VTSLQLVQNCAAVSATYEDGHSRVWNLDTDFTFAERLIQQGTTQTSEPLNTRKDLLVLSQLQTAQDDGSAGSVWPGKSEPPEWLAGVLERCAGKAVIRSEDGDWGIRNLTPSEVSNRRLLKLTAPHAHEPWIAWMRWIESTSPKRSAFPGLELSEALLLPRSMIDFPSNAKTIPLPRRLSVESYRPLHWLVPFEWASQALYHSNQSVTAEVEKLIGEGKNRIAALSKKERPLCWAAAAYYVARGFPPNFSCELADEAVRLAPNDPQVQLLVGFAMLKYPEAANYMKAVPHFRKAVESGSNSASLYWLARSEAAIGNIPASLKCYQQALASGLESQEWAVLEYAIVLLNNGAATEAAAFLQKTVAKRQRNPSASKAVSFANTKNILALLTVALWRSDRHAEAQKVYVEALGTRKFPLTVDGMVKTPINQTLKDIHAEVERLGLLTK
jgi:tetratricopeptide (TPR) repeat protein